MKAVWVIPLVFLTVGAAGAGAQTGAPADTLAASGSGRGPLLDSSDIVLGAVFLASFGAIWLEEVDHWIERQPDGTNSPARRFGRTLGNGVAVAGLSGVTFLVGEAVGSETTARVGLRSLESFLLAAGLASVLKISFGRARPDTGLDSRHFEPFAFESRLWSFPSGHTVNVFALATTVSSELRDDAPWVPFVAYPLAGWTGLTRILDGKHWLTDVVAGAAVGIFSAHVIDRLHRTPDAGDHVTSGMTARPLLSSVGGQFLIGVNLNFN